MGGAADTVTASFDADALAAYKSACTAVGDSAAWAALPPTEYSCVADNYVYNAIETNFGSCYPTTAACAEYGQGSAAIISYVADEMSEVGITCTVADATTATDTTPTTTNVDPAASANANPTNGDSDATDAPVTTNGDSDATDAPVDDSQTASTNGSTTSAAASSMIASFSAATVAAAVGTVMYL